MSANYVLPYWLTYSLVKLIQTGRTQFRKFEPLLQKLNHPKLTICFR